MRRKSILQDVLYVDIHGNLTEYMLKMCYSSGGSFIFVKKAKNI